MDVIVSVIVGVLLIVAALGTIIPVLPGCILAIAALLTWAIAVGGAVGWTVFLIGAVLCVTGILASTILTGARLKKREIPNRSILIGALVGVVGMFVIPVVGLFAGFVLGLYCSEWFRLQNAKQAVRASGTAITSVGLGILVEFLCVCLSASIWIVGVIVYF